MVNPATCRTARHMVVELLIRCRVEVTQVGGFGGLAWIWRALRIHDIPLRYGRVCPISGSRLLPPDRTVILIGTRDPVVKPIRKPKNSLGVSSSSVRQMDTS